VPCFLSALGKLQPKEQEAVMCVLLLTQILDGCLEKPELELWSRVVQQVGRQQGPDELALRGCACAFRNSTYNHTEQSVVDAKLLLMALDEDDSNDRSVFGRQTRHFWGCFLTAAFWYTLGENRPAELGLGDSLWFKTRKLLLK